MLINHNFTHHSCFGLHTGASFIMTAIREGDIITTHKTPLFKEKIEQ